MFKKKYLSLEQITIHYNAHYLTVITYTKKNYQEMYILRKQIKIDFLN